MRVYIRWHLSQKTTEEEEEEREEEKKARTLPRTPLAISTKVSTHFTQRLFGNTWYGGYTCYCVLYVRKRDTDKEREKERERVFRSVTSRSLAQNVKCMHRPAEMSCSVHGAHAPSERVHSVSCRTERVQSVSCPLCMQTVSDGERAARRGL